MSVLEKYKPTKLPDARPAGKDSPRKRLLYSLEKQLEMAELVADGKEVPKTPSGKATKTWWVEVNGTVYLNMYMNNSRMSFGEELDALEIGQIEDLPYAIRDIMKGVEAGDLDPIMRKHLLEKARKNKKRSS